MKDFNTWFYRYKANGKEFMANTEYYGFSVKIDGKTIKFNHNYKMI